MATSTFMIFLSSISIENYIQISITIVLLLTAILSFLSYSWNKKQSEIHIFNSIVKESRSINIKNQDDLIMFNFYEYLAILLFRKGLNKNLFYNYFSFVIGQVYMKFMESKYFESPEDRFLIYPHLSQLFNDMGLSIKKILF